MFLVRHPEPVGSAGVCYGRTDLDVTPGSVAVAADRVSEVLRSRCVTSAGLDGSEPGCVTSSGLAGSEPGLVVVSSPLRRCTALAQALGTYECDDRLVELDFGDWEGVDWNEIDRTDFDHWAADHVHNRVPGGESWADVRDRMRFFLADVRKRASSTIVVITHTGVIRAVLSLILGIPLETTWAFEISFGCIVELGLAPDGDKLILLSPGPDRQVRPHDPQASLSAQSRP